MLDARERLGEHIRSHLLRTDQFQVNRSIGNTLPNEVIPHINVLRCTMVHRIPREEIGRVIVDMERSWPRYLFLQLRQ